MKILQDFLQNNWSTTNGGGVRKCSDEGFRFNLCFKQNYLLVVINHNYYDNHKIDIDLDCDNQSLSDTLSSYTISNNIIGLPISKNTLHVIAEDFDQFIEKILDLSLFL